jgi:hypothetical protein
MFLAINGEVTNQADWWRKNSGALANDDVNAWYTRLVAINSLWMNKETFRYMFRLRPGDPIHRRIHSDCEACILAAIGGNTSMVQDLYFSANTRRKKGKPEPSILNILRPWIEHLGIADEVALHNDGLHMLIRTARRHPKRVGRKPSPASPVLTRTNSLAETVGEGDVEDAKSKDTLEAVIDFYTDRLANTTDQDLTSLHPAFSLSHIFERPEGARPSSESSSRYSRSTAGSPHISETEPQTGAGAFTRTPSGKAIPNYLTQRSAAYHALLADSEKKQDFASNPEYEGTGTTDDPPPIPLKNTKRRPQSSSMWAPDLFDYYPPTQEDSQTQTARFRAYRTLSGKMSTADLTVGVPELLKEFRKNSEAGVEEVEYGSRRRGSSSTTWDDFCPPPLEPLKLVPKGKGKKPNEAKKPGDEEEGGKKKQRRLPW